MIKNIVKATNNLSITENADFTHCHYDILCIHPMKKEF